MSYFEFVIKHKIAHVLGKLVVKKFTRRYSRLMAAHQNSKSALQLHTAVSADLLQNDRNHYLILITGFMGLSSGEVQSNWEIEQKNVWTSMFWGFFFLLFLLIHFYERRAGQPHTSHTDVHAYWVCNPCLSQKIMFEPSSSYVLKNLKPFSTYTFQLAARSKHGVGAFTSELSIQTPQSRTYTHLTRTHIQIWAEQSKTVTSQHFRVD